MALSRIVYPVKGSYRYRALQFSGILFSMTKPATNEDSQLEQALTGAWRKLYEGTRKQPDIIENAHSKERAIQFNRLLAGVVLGWQQDGLTPNQTTLLATCEEIWRSVDKLMVRHNPAQRGTQGYEQSVLDATYTWVHENRNGADYVKIYASFPAVGIPEKLLQGFCAMVRGRYVQDTDRVVTLAFSGIAGRPPALVTPNQQTAVNLALRDLFVTRLRAYCADRDEPAPQAKPRILHRIRRHFALARI